MPTDRFDIDSALYNAIPRGALTKLAQHRAVSVELISRDYIPHNTDYQSKFSRALVELEVIARVCPEWAQNILKVVNSFGVRWCGTVRPSGMQDVIGLAVKVFDPETPLQDRLPLALRLQDEVNKVVDGLRFDDLDDTNAERPLVSAR